MRSHNDIDSLNDCTATVGGGGGEGGGGGPRRAAGRGTPTARSSLPAPPRPRSRARWLPLAAPPPASHRPAITLDCSSAQPAPSRRFALRDSGKESHFDATGRLLFQQLFEVMPNHVLRPGSDRVPVGAGVARQRDEVIEEEDLNHPGNAQQRTRQG